MTNNKGTTKSPFHEWKEKIEKQWDYGRKQVIFEDGEGNFIIPTTTTSTTTTTTPKPTPGNTSFVTSPVVVINQTTVTPRSDEVVRADTGELIKIIGITCGALVSILIISLVCIRLCRVSAKKRKERVSVRRPLNIEPEEHIYAEIEPLQGPASEGPSGASASGSSGVQLPRKKGKGRRRGVSSFRAFSTRIYRFFSTDNSASDDNQSVFYNRSQDTSSSVQNAPDPPRRNVLNGKTKRGKGTGVKRYESQSRRPLLDGDSQISTTSSNLDARDNVYNPLLREESGRVSGPYDHLRLSKTQSGTVKDPDQVPPHSPHDYFTLEKETGAEGEQEYPTTSFPMENIAEVDVEDNKSVSNVIAGIENVLPDDLEEVSETPKNHDYFILEPTHDTIESPTKTSVKAKSDVKSKSDVKENSAKADTDDEVSKATKTDTGDKSASLKSSSSGKSKPVPKPRSLGSPTAEEKTLPPNSSESLKEKNSIEKLLQSAGDKPKNAYTPLGDTLGAKGGGETVNGKDEDYVLTKLGDAPKPPVPAADSEDKEDYLVPAHLKQKPDYVEVTPLPPPRTTSKSPDVSPAPSRTNSKEYPLVTTVHPGKNPKEDGNVPPTVPKHSPHVSPTHSGASPKNSPQVSPKPLKSPSKEHSRMSPKKNRPESKDSTKLSPLKHSVTMPKQTSVETDV